MHHLIKSNVVPYKYEPIHINHNIKIKEYPHLNAEPNKYYMNKGKTLKIDHTGDNVIHRIFNLQKHDDFKHDGGALPDFDITYQRNLTTAPSTTATTTAPTTAPPRASTPTKASPSSPIAVKSVYENETKTELKQKVKDKTSELEKQWEDEANIFEFKTKYDKEAKPKDPKTINRIKNLVDEEKKVHEDNYVTPKSVKETFKKFGKALVKNAKENKMKKMEFDEAMPILPPSNKKKGATKLNDDDDEALPPVPTDKIPIQFTSQMTEKYFNAIDLSKTRKFNEEKINVLRELFNDDENIKLGITKPILEKYIKKKYDIQTDSAIPKRQFKYKYK